MINNTEWVPNAAAESMRNWTENLYIEAKKLLIQDGTHASLLFLFNKKNGLVSVNSIPTNINHNQLNEAIENAIHQHQLYGVIFIGEVWTYFMKENDHTAFQILDGEMNISDLNAKDKNESLMIRMENMDDEGWIYLDEIIQNEKSVSLRNKLNTKNSQKKWFIHQ